jgi:hypothetical protein
VRTIRRARAICALRPRGGLDDQHTIALIAATNDPTRFRPLPSILKPAGVAQSALVCGSGSGLTDFGYPVHVTRTSNFVQRLQLACSDIQLLARIARLNRAGLLLPYGSSYVQCYVRMPPDLHEPAQ